MKAFVIAVLGAAVLGGSSLLAQDAKLVSEGKKLYGSKECDKCHIIAGKGNKIGPLDGVGTKLNEADIRKWFTHPVEMEKALTKRPKVKMSSKAKQMNLKAAEIDALTAYMLTLTKK
jgi:cytochrome c